MEFTMLCTYSQVFDAAVQCNRVPNTDHSAKPPRCHDMANALPSGVHFISVTDPHTWLASETTCKYTRSWIFFFFFFGQKWGKRIPQLSKHLLWSLLNFTGRHSVGSFSFASSNVTVAPKQGAGEVLWHISSCKENRRSITRLPQPSDTRHDWEQGTRCTSQPSRAQCRQEAA